MPIDPSIAMGVRPIEQPNMLGQMAQVMAMRQAQQEYEGSQGVNELARRGVKDPNEYLQYGPAGRRTYESILKGQKDLREGQKLEVELGITKIGAFRDQLNANVNDPAAAAKWLTAINNDPLVGKILSSVPLEDQIAGIPTDPKGFADWKNRTMLKTPDFVKHFVESADAKLSSRTSLATNAATVGATKRGQDLTEARERERMNYDQKYPTMNQVITAQGVGVTPSRGPNVGQITPVYEPGAAPPPAAAPAATTIFSSVGGGPLGSGTYGVPNALAQGAPSNMLRPNAQAPAAAGVAPVRAQPAPSAPTLTEVANPDNPMETMRVDARRYKGGGPNSPGVLGIVKTGTLNPAQQLKVKKEMALDFKAVDKTIAETNELLKSIDAVRNSDLEAVAGPFDVLTKTVKDDSLLAETRFASLKGKVTAIAKAASTMTGAIGSIANQEWNILANQIAVLDLKQGKNANLEQIEQLERQALSIANRMRAGFERQYGEHIDTLGPQYREIPDVTYKMGSEGFTKSGQKRPAKSSATPASTGDIMDNAGIAKVVEFGSLK